MKNKNKFLIFVVVMLVIAVNFVINSPSKDYANSLNSLLLVAQAESENAQQLCEAAGGVYNKDELYITIPLDEPLVTCKWDPNDCCTRDDLRD